MTKRFSIKDRVCVVTGAGKGIGRETSRLFYEEGAFLALITRDGKDLKSLKTELDLDDKRVLLFEGDVSDEKTVKRFIAQAAEKFGRIDVLVNNAGMRFRKKFLETTPDEWARVMNTNLASVYLMCREAGPHMIRQKYGRVINIASVIGTLGLAGLTAYGASKGGMITLTKCLALEWAEHNVNVNAIAPGFCETSYAENFKKKEELYKFTIKRTPQKRWGSPADVATACLFLASGEASFITGEVLSVDGGWSAW